MRIRTFLFGLLAMVALGSPMVSAAQDADGIVPDPDLCTLEPTSRERLDAVIAMTIVPATPFADAGFGTPVSMPDIGAPVTPEVQAAIEEAMIENVACINTGNALLQMSIYSDMGLSRLLGEGITSITDAQFDSLATPAALTPEQFSVLHEFGEAVDLGDGRVAIVIVGDDMSEPDPASPTLFVLVEQNGHWVVDSFETTED
ncbi:MAG: hypothetical protein KF883_14360 [Thermomicrobiales bacterium]|nr:hypothetical protein [Thermomicrobiales bacterium]